MALGADYRSETRQLQTFAAHPEQLVTFWLMRLTQGEVQLLKSGPWGSQYPSGPTHMYEATPKERGVSRGRGSCNLGVSLCVSLKDCTGLNQAKPHFLILRNTVSALKGD